MAERTSAVIYAYGQRGTPKCQYLFGAAGAQGWAQRLLEQLCECGLNGSILTAEACAMGDNTQLTDLFDPSNKAAAVLDTVDSVSFGSLTALTVADRPDVSKAVATLLQNVEELARGVRKPEILDPLDGTVVDNECPCVPYDPSYLILTIKRYESAEAQSAGQELNSLHLVVCGDSERPPLCVFHMNQVARFAALHKTHSAVVSVLSAIRTGRLRIPFNKSTLTNVLRRAYNQDKSCAASPTNAPTQSYVIIFAFQDANHAEETFHALSAAKHVTTVTGSSGGLGPISRDIHAERWRLEQDTMDLQDELHIAKVVHDYKPCIFGQAKPVANIEEEEAKRMVTIRRKKEESRSRAAAQLKGEAEARAQRVLQKEAEEFEAQVQALRARLQELLRLNEDGGGDKADKEKGKGLRALQKELEKTIHKREEEDRGMARLLGDIRGLEERFAATELRTQHATKRLQVLRENAADVQQLLMDISLPPSEREQRVTQRRTQRQTLLKQCEVDGTPKADTSVSGKFAKQYEEYKALVQANAEKRGAGEKGTVAALEQQRAAYKVKLGSHALRIKREELLQAFLAADEARPEEVTAKAMALLRHGCGMWRLSGKGSSDVVRRWVFLSDDHQAVLSCDMTEAGHPVDRNRPRTPPEANLADVRCVTLGQFSEAFLGFRALRDFDSGVLLDDQRGSFDPALTAEPDGSTVQKYFYRSFSLHTASDTTVDLIAESDADFECWVMALRRLITARHGGGSADAVAWGGSLRIDGRAGIALLQPNEVDLCCRCHILPQQYVDAKQDALPRLKADKAAGVLALRKGSALDLVRAQDALEFWKARGLL
eukprot:GGOE01017941.1.p1 GENE.GGOE01017941.1~~GGOE01017941.1.p1  ORF type:complete len:912 (+),score=278.07 GGOE01017941.1:245-2737(+)